MTEVLLTSRPAASDDDATHIFRLLIEMYKEVGRFPLDPNKAFEEVYRVVKHEAAWIVEDQDGLAVASLGVATQPGLWYSPNTPFLAEQWFYVLPALRNRVARQLLEAELAAFCEAVKLPAMIKYFAPDKLARQGRKVFVGEESLYIPSGRIARINPFAVPQVSEG